MSATLHPLKPLSARELEVLQCAYTGKTNAEIAEILGVSPLTVKNHVENMLRKLDAANRTQAVSKAIQLGLVGDTASPDVKPLLEFYQVTTLRELVDAQAHHVERLQAKCRSGSGPWLR